MASVSNGKRHVVKRKQTREKVCGVCLNANSCNMQNQNKYFGNRKAFLPPFSTEFSPLYMCCNIHHFGITKRKVMASKLQVKALLHYATCVATCLAILLRHKLQVKLQGVTCLAIIKSRNIFVVRSIARSGIRFYFSQRLPQRCNTFFRHCSV